MTTDRDQQAYDYAARTISPEFAAALAPNHEPVAQISMTGMDELIQHRAYDLPVAQIVRVSYTQDMTTTQSERKARTNQIKAVTGGRWAATAVRTGADLVTKVQTFNSDTEAIAEALTAAGYTVTRQPLGESMTNLFV